jgi:antitoxin (DNA-binding transcriptional repressor) of toxin-antitoxin stability system
MTDHGSYITVEAEEQSLDELLRTVREGNRPVRILIHGEPVADLSPVYLRRFGPPDPQLRAKILVEGNELTTEEDWPEEYR